MGANIWKDFSTLRKIKVDISRAGYSYEYAYAHHLFDILHVRMKNLNNRIVWFEEPLEVKRQGGKILYRVSDKLERKMPIFFNTSLGRFENHNNGEFASWIKLGGVEVIGNFEDVFDYGGYVYAVANQMHMGRGSFGLLRIDKTLGNEWLYENQQPGAKEWESFRYLGKTMDSECVKIFVSGHTECYSPEGYTGPFHDKSKVLRIGIDGSFSIAGDYDYAFGNANSIALMENKLYLGQNHMIAVVDLNTGTREYYTDKPQKVVEQLKKHRY